MILEQDQLTLRVRKAIVSAAKAIDLRASFAPGRRKSDVLLVKLRGKREHAHIIATHLVDIFPEIDIEVLKGIQQDNYYNFTLVVTQKLADQEVIAKERRAKLIATIAKELNDPNQLAIPQELHDTLFLENI